MNKIPLLALICLCSIGCTSTRVPTSAAETVLGKFKLPKDMDVDIQGLEYTRDTNGVVTLTVKSIRTKSRNNPEVIGAGTAQIEANWNGVANVAERVTETAIKATAGK